MYDKRKQYIVVMVITYTRFNGDVMYDLYKK